MKNKIDQALLKLYEIAYAEATPSADFHKLMENAEVNEIGQKVINFDEYVLNQERQNQLFEEVSREFRLNKWQKKCLSFNYYLGCCPRFEKK